MPVAEHDRKIRVIVQLFNIFPVALALRGNALNRQRECEQQSKYLAHIVSPQSHTLHGE